jgi:hypothetical protein
MIVAREYRDTLPLDTWRLLAPARLIKGITFATPVTLHLAPLCLANAALAPLPQPCSSLRSHHACLPAVRAWIDKVGGPKWDDRADPPAQRLTRRQINDRWGQHSRECTACQAAVANLRRQAAAFAGAAAALVAALAGAAASAGLPRLLSGGAPAALGAGALAGAAIAAAAALRAWRMLAQFEYVEYFAADNN